MPSPPRLFNPSSPFAFEPPAYETLSKEPPKYAEIWQGEENAAFVNETRTENSSSSTSNMISRTRSTDVRPPPYREQEEMVERPGTSRTDQTTPAEVSTGAVCNAVDKSSTETAPNIQSKSSSEEHVKETEKVTVLSTNNNRTDITETEYGSNRSNTVEMSNSAQVNSMTPTNSASDKNNTALTNIDIA